MGWNTVALLFNDQSNEWPPCMRRAMSARDRGPEFAHFGFGEIVSAAHASGMQVVVAGGNTARRVSAIDAAEQSDLDALAEVLKGHGYSIKRPGRTRSEGPLSWGFWAAQKRVK